MEARVCRAAHLLSLPHRAHAVAENLGTDGPRIYFSVIQLLLLKAKLHCKLHPLLRTAKLCHIRPNLNPNLTYRTKTKLTGTQNVLSTDVREIAYP